ncbi:MAG: hypothetical protein ACP5OA_05690 [Candidatus Woesearchaeota archaeon]
MKKDEIAKMIRIINNKTGISHRKGGQIQMGETVAVTIIVIILLVLGIVFWNKISNSNVEEVVIQSQELSVIEIANVVSDLPELQCSESGVNKAKCLDMYKIRAMNISMDIPEVRKYYNEYFKNSRITIMKVYPEPDPAYENITIYDAQLNNTARTLQISLPINIYDSVQDSTIYGLIIVEGYYR